MSQNMDTRKLVNHVRIRFAESSLCDRARRDVDVKTSCWMTARQGKQELDCWYSGHFSVWVKERANMEDKVKTGEGNNFHYNPLRNIRDKKFIFSSFHASENSFLFLWKAQNQRAINGSSGLEQLRCAYSNYEQKWNKKMHYPVSIFHEWKLFFLFMRVKSKDGSEKTELFLLTRPLSGED